MNEEFKKAFDSLSYAYKKIIVQVIRMMDKKNEKVKKFIDIRKLINYYRERKGLTHEQLINEISQIDSTFNENTYYSILKRNLVDIKNNETIKLIVQVLDIPVDSNGIPYISRKLPYADENSFLYKTEHKDYVFTPEALECLTKFHQNSIYYGFDMLSEKDKKIILYLVHCFNNYTIAPDVFENDEYE